MGELHFEILFSEIFTRVPAKTVGRLKVLSKRCYYELCTKKFATVHFKRISKPGNKKFMTIEGSSIVTFNTVLGQHDATFSNSIYGPTQLRFSDVQFLSSLNGLLLVCDKNTSALILWNPTTVVFKVVSDSEYGNSYNYQHDAAGLFMDSSNDYKILHIKRRGATISPYVYSRRSASWRAIGVLDETRYITTDFVWSSGTFCKNSLFFIVSKYWSDYQCIIVAFDVTQETFKRISLPAVQQNLIPQGHIVRIDDTHHMFLSRSSPDLDMELWKLDSSIWIKVLSFSNVRQLNLDQLLSVRDVVNAGTWLLMADWGHFFKVFMDVAQLEYLFHADTFRGLRGAMFNESVISPFV